MYCLNRSIVCYSSGTQDEEFVLFTYMEIWKGKKGKIWSTIILLIKIFLLYRILKLVPYF